MDEGLCQALSRHPGLIAGVLPRLTDDPTLFDMAALFKVLSDPSRLKIVNALLLCELCVCDIAEVMGMTQPAVSHHLKALRAAKLVKYRREGKSAFYSLSDEHIGLLFNICRSHVLEEK